MEDKLNEADIILSERKTYLQELKKDRDQALKYKDLADNLKRSKATHTHIQIQSKKEKQDSLEKDIKRYGIQIKKTQDEIDRLIKDISIKKQEISDITKEIEEKGEKEQVKIMKDIEQLKINVATNKTRMSSNANEITRVQ